MKITYYLEVISSWCHWAEPAWTELRTLYADRVEFTWKIALMDASGLPTSRDQCDWFYRRSGTLVHSPYVLNSGWFDPSLRSYPAPNLVAEAAKDFGVTDDRVRLALAHAALRDGQQVGDWNLSARLAAKTIPAQLDADNLLEHARSPAVEARVHATTAEFHALGVTQRPTFLLENALGDRVILSGLAGLTPLLAAADALLADEAAQISYNVHHTPPDV